MIAIRNDTLNNMQKAFQTDTFKNRIFSPIQTQAILDSVTAPMTAGLSKETAGVQVY